MYFEPAVFEYGFMRRRSCFVPMRPVGRIGGIFSKNRPANLDKLRLKTPATLDAAMLLGWHLCKYPEPAVCDYGFIRRRGCFVPMRPVGKDGSIFTKNPNF